MLEPVRRLSEVTGRTPPAFVFRYARPHDAASAAWAAAAGAGVRHALSNTAVESVR